MLPPSQATLPEEEDPLNERGMTPEWTRLHATYAALPDPAVWQEDPTTGELFRRTTKAEQAANEWAPSTFLVTTRGLDGAIAGESSVTLVVPVAEVAAVSVELPLVSIDEREFAETPVNGRGSPIPDPTAPSSSITRTNVHYYELTDEDGAIIALVRAVSSGGFFARASLGGVSAEMLGHEKWWTIDSVPTSTGQEVDAHVALVTLVPTYVPPPAALLSESEADSGFSVMTVTSYNSATMGEMQWCVRNTANWKALIDQTASEIASAFTGNGGTNAAIARKHDHCWTNTNLANAQWCSDVGPCYDSSGHTYPYGGDGTNSANWLADAWADVTHSRQHFTFDGLRVTQTVYDGQDMLYAGSTSICGEARPDHLSNAGAIAMSVPQPTGCRQYVDAHETGHNFDALHDDSYYGSLQERHRAGHDGRVHLQLVRDDGKECDQRVCWHLDVPAQRNRVGRPTGWRGLCSPPGAIFAHAEEPSTPSRWLPQRASTRRGMPAPSSRVRARSRVQRNRGSTALAGLPRTSKRRRRWQRSRVRMRRQEATSPAAGREAPSSAQQA